MASRTALLITAAMAVVIMCALLQATASATVYRVGDDAGWNEGVDYNAWASDKEFKIGDTLEFVYTSTEEEEEEEEDEEPTNNDVLLVDVASYEACTVPRDALMMTFGSGDDHSVVLGAAGQFFLICADEERCENGMKLAINVH